MTFRNIKNFAYERNIYKSGAGKIIQEDIIQTQSQELFFYHKYVCM